MLAKLHTFSLLGIDALPVEVEVRRIAGSTAERPYLSGFPSRR
jgi:hypothetical protein